MTKIIKRKKEQPKVSDGLVHVAIFTYGSFEKFLFRAQFSTPEAHFHPYVGWEMKDCVTMSLPSEWKYAVVKDIISKHPFHALIVQPEY